MIKSGTEVYIKKCVFAGSNEPADWFVRGQIGIAYDLREEMSGDDWEGCYRVTIPDLGREVLVTEGEIVPAQSLAFSRQSATASSPKREYLKLYPEAYCISLSHIKGFEYYCGVFNSRNDNRPVVIRTSSLKAWQAALDLEQQARSEAR